MFQEIAEKSSGHHRAEIVLVPWFLGSDRDLT